MLTEEMKAAVRDFYSRVGATLPDFKSRRGQREMIAAISNALGRARLKDDDPATGQNIAVVEGRTGVGKTVGYLVPALALAHKLEKKIIVSTGTVALQEQLHARDLPALCSQLGRPVQTHLAKGRRRYVCPSRLDQMAGDAEQESLFGADAAWERRPEEGEIRQLRDLRARFANKGWSGDRDALPEPLRAELWNRISTDAPGCTGRRCASFANCPFQNARAALLKADVIVVNHDLLLSCLASDSKLLPPMKDAVVIFDEAHHLPSVAVSRFALSSGIVSSVKWIERCPALLMRVSAMLPEPQSTGAAAEAARGLLKKLGEYAAALRHGDAFAKRATLRYPFGRLDEASAELATSIAGHAQELVRVGAEIGEQFASALADGKIGTSSGELVLRDLGPLLARLEALGEFWLEFATEDADNRPPYARWIEQVDGGRDYVANVSPISSASMLKRHIWSQASAVVLASATIRSLGSFNFFLSKSGLSFLPDVTAVSVTSPFNYAEQGELHIPRMRADPKDAAAHTAEVAQLMPTLLASSASGSLALFASRRQMEEVASALPEPIRGDVLVQGSRSRSDLLREHVERVTAGRRSILFGLAGLGEGLDLPGRLCEHVIVAKIPFAPPESPLEEALAEWIDRNGGNAFSELSLPNAGLILVQWVGRLIRKEEDHGRITILDNRLVSKSYGRRLIAGLPEFRRVAA